MGMIQTDAELEMLELRLTREGVIDNQVTRMELGERGSFHAEEGGQGEKGEGRMNREIRVPGRVHRTSDQRAWVGRTSTERIHGCVRERGDRQGESFDPGDLHFIAKAMLALHVSPCEAGWVLGGEEELAEKQMKR